jgi:pimeloyl-ACP methyl ester carboxylesterase
MKNLTYLFIGLLLASCDVDSAMLWGNDDGAYDFSNAVLPEDYDYTVDESLVDVFTLESDDNGDKANIYCVYVGDKSKIATDTVILYCHGNGPYLDLFWPKAVHLANLGGKHRYGIMMYDYRGFGKSEGTSTGMGTMMADVNACLDWLKAKGLTGDRMVLLGESLGSIPGTYVAGSSEILVPEKYIYEVPQSQADAIAQGASGLSMPSSFLTDFNFDLLAEMKKYPNQLFWMHGTEDKTAPVENARQVYDAHTGSYKRAVVVEGAPHGLRDYMGIEEWGHEVLDFILHE